jgi:plastocyanin
MALCVRASAVKPQVAKAQARKAPVVQKVAQAAAVGISSLALALSAHADATVKLGADSGALVFEPASVTIKAGETVTWVNNAGYPHNIVFDEDAIPSGENADALSHEDYLNAPGEKASSTFKTPGSYSYYCEPHQGAGMQGKVIVQ